MKIFFWAMPCLAAGCTLLLGGFRQVCGDGLLQGSEQCDDGGQATGDGCDAGCQLENVIPLTCDGVAIDANEVCDGANLNGATCQSEGFLSGTIGCLADCSGLDLSGCSNCGDGIINNNEDCDGTNLNAQSCANFNNGVGNLSCNADCTFNLSECCGDGSNDPSHLCYEAPSSTPAAFLVSVLSVVDLNNDSKKDILSNEVTNQTRLHAHLQTTIGSFVDVPTDTGNVLSNVVPSSFGGLDPDLLVVQPFRGKVMHFDNIDNGAFVAGLEIDSDPGASTATAPGPLAVGDFNHDNLPDWVVINLGAQNGSPVFVCLEDGTGDCSSIGGGLITLTPGFSPTAVAVGEFLGGDDFDDIALLIIGAGQTIDLMIFQNDGTGSFSGALSVSLENTTAPPSQIAAADFDGDGDDEVAVTFPTLNEVKTFDSVIPRSFLIGQASQNLVTDDFNGDGRPDIAVTNPNSGSLTIALGTGDGDFIVQPEIAICTNPAEIASGDLNNDTLPDLVVNCVTQIGLLLSNP